MYIIVLLVGTDALGNILYIISIQKLFKPNQTITLELKKVKPIAGIVEQLSTRIHSQKINCLNV